MKSGGPGRLIIHCGVQKTASTAFHHFVKRNHDALAPWLEIRTPQKGSPTRDLGRVSALYSLDDQHEIELIARIAGLRDEVLQSGKTCLISHENIPGAMMGRGGVTTLYPEIGRILGLFDDHFAPLRPEYVFYIRDMDRWKASVHNQAVRSDNYQGSFDQFLTETAECGSWNSLQERVEAQVGAERCHFLTLEDETDPDRPGQQLLRLAGVPDSVLDELSPLTGRRNTSLNQGALEFLRLVNELQLPHATRNPVAQLIQARQDLFATDPEVR